MSLRGDCKLQIAEQLTRPQRLVVEMYFGDELSLAEIGEVLAIEPGHVGAILRSVVEQAARRPRAAK